MDTFRALTLELRNSSDQNLLFLLQFLFHLCYISSPCIAQLQSKLEKDKERGKRREARGEEVERGREKEIDTIFSVSCTSARACSHAVTSGVFVSPPPLPISFPSPPP